MSESVKLVHIFADVSDCPMQNAGLDSEHAGRGTKFAFYHRTLFPLMMVLFLRVMFHLCPQLKRTLLKGSLSIKMMVQPRLDLSLLCVI